MRNQPETLHEYSIPRLHWWFLLSGFVFLLSLVLMIWVDYAGGYLPWLALHGDREWKNYQHQFYAVDMKRIAADAKAAEVKANEAGLSKMQEDLDKTKRELEGKKPEEAKLQAAVDQAKVEDDLITRDFTMKKALRDQERSLYEEALERNNMNMDAPEVRESKDKAESQNELVAKLDLRKQQADAKLQAAKDALTALMGHEVELEHNIKRFDDGIKLLTTRYNQLDSALVQGVVNAPIIEFAAGTIKVEQIIADNHHTDVNFATVPRVDRCIMCHKGIDRKDPTPEDRDWRAKHKIEVIEWSKQPQPLRNHPQMDLFVGDTSPHPASTYGCTVCHWGWDRETTFSRSGHTPDAEEKQPYVLDPSTKKWVKAPKSEDGEDDDTKAQKVAVSKTNVVEMTQKTAWQKNHNWEEEEFLMQPMRSARYVQASCLKCHNAQTNLKGGEKLDHGRRLIEQLGCWSCHKMRQMETYTTHHVAAGEDFEGLCKFYDVNADDVRRLNGFPQEVSLTIGQDVYIPIRTLRKPGPSLYQVASKTNKEWMRKWLANPVAFRPNTYMPRFWGLDNNAGTPDRNAVEINAIAEYLFAVNDQPKYPAPIQGDAENGKKLVGQLGCMGCHVIDEKLMDIKVPASLKQYMDDWQYRRLRSQGPQLAGAGSKTGANWLFAWLKDPKQYHPRTKMPNLRLADQEAADVASYLASLHNEKTDQETLPETKAELLDKETVEYLQVTLPMEEARQKINNLDDLIELYFVDEETMKYYQDQARLAREGAQLKALQKEFEETFDDAVDRKAKKLAAQIEQVKAKMQAAKQTVAAMQFTDKKNVYLGSKLISRYGCYACHDIHGFETAKPIGTELSEWGSKPVDKLDFGLVDIEKNRLSWLKQKLHAPRSFDQGRIDVTRMPQELLKMPKFNLTDEQIDQIVTVISGMTDEKLTPNEARQLTPAEFQIERGRWTVKELNCIGCHIVEAQGGAIRATGIATGMEPPLLSGTPTQLHQGQRTQPDWLFQFIKAPQTGQVRPWLHVRMPTFGLTDGEANVLVKYFALQGEAQFPYQSPKIDMTPEHLAAGKQLFDQLKCALCHIVEGKALGKPLAEIPEEDLPRLAPNLSQAHERLQRDWLVNKWLVEPLAQQPGTRMPQFEYGAAIAPNVLGGDGRKQIEALVDYVLTLGTHEQTAQVAPTLAPVTTPTQPQARP